MATAELVFEGSFEVEFTSPRISSDQPKALGNSTSSPTPTPTTIVLPPTPTPAVDPSPPPAQDSGSQTIPVTTDPQKRRSALLDDNGTPQVCQHVEIVTEETCATESSLPKIDAVWSISQEHSYEQKLHKPTKHKGSPAGQTRAEPELIQDTPSGNGTRCVETQHAPMLLHSQAESEVLKAHTAHMSQIVKIQNKTSKKFFIHDSVGPCSKPSKYLNLHSGNTHNIAKSFKTLKVLQLPSHKSTHSCWNSCLIDHNLKPLQIKHNLEHKNKALAVLKLETLNLKYRNDVEDSTHYSLHPEPPPSPTSPFSEQSHKGKFHMKDADTDLDEPEDSQMHEVGMDAVYLDVDSGPSSNGSFVDNALQEEDMEKRGWKEDGAGQCHVHNLSMDHYLPDFTDLPPFHNIPMDQPEDQYSEPTHLTPSIQHNVFDNDWPQAYPIWNPQASPTFPTPVGTAHESAVSLSTLPNPSPVIMVPNTAATPSLLPGQTSTIPNTTSVDQLVDSAVQTSLTTTPEVGGGGTADSEPRTSSCSDSPLLTITSTMGATADSASTASLLITATTEGVPMTTSIKIEPESSWSGPVHMTQPPTVMSTLALPPTRSAETTLTTTSSTESQVLHTDSAISTALMTAFDMDSQPPGTVDGHTSGLDSNVSCPYPDHTYPDPTYTQHHSPEPCGRSCGDGGGAEMGCSSSFLSPPPSVEPQASQHSTPCPDNESGYLTMEEQELPSPAGLYWPHPPHHHPHHRHHFTPGSGTEDVDNNSYVNGKTTYPATEYGEGSGYPYTHQDSHYQTLNQTASTATGTGNSDIIYYPFNDLMQLNPSLLGSDSEMSIQYVHPHSYPNPYPPQTMVDPSSDPALNQTFLNQSGTGRRRGRGGRPRGARQCMGNQIQSDQISSSLHRQLQVHMEAPPKRQYRRRNPDGRKKAAVPRAPRCSLLEGAERRGRHNEPLNQKAVDIMYEWYRQHEDNPYPTKEEKELMALEGNITTMQVKSWFANKRNRSNNTRPKVQKRAMEEKLMQIYNQLSKTEGASVQEGGNSFIIKELSQIIHNKLEPDNPATPESAT